MGAFNGLHLAIRARARKQTIASIVIGDADHGLQEEARQQHVRDVAEPLEEAIFSATVREAMVRVD